MPAAGAVSDVVHVVPDTLGVCAAALQRPRGHGLPLRRGRRRSQRPLVADVRFVQVWGEGFRVPVSLHTGRHGPNQYRFARASLYSALVRLVRYGGSGFWCLVSLNHGSCNMCSTSTDLHVPA